MVFEAAGIRSLSHNIMQLMTTFHFKITQGGLIILVPTISIIKMMSGILMNNCQNGIPRADLAKFDSTGVMDWIED
jgi:uncharacterized membrane protein YjjB (DUF3815 family)